MLRSIIIYASAALGILAAAPRIPGGLRRNSAAEPPGRADGVLVKPHVAAQDVTEFYCTWSSSAYPPHYQRYHFSAADGKRVFFHETREGRHWPLTEADAVRSGTAELTEAEWAAFLDCLRGGTVTKRSEYTESGGTGPWLYLCWTGDRGRQQQFTFASPEAKAAFETLCERLRDGMSIPESRNQKE